MRFLPLMNFSASSSVQVFPAFSAFSCAFLTSFFGSPRWLIKTKERGPCSKIYLIVGRAAIIRVSSCTTPSFIGTLKSTRITMRLPFKSMSFTVLIIVNFSYVKFVIKIYIFPYKKSIYRKINYQITDFLQILLLHLV